MTHVDGMPFEHPQFANPWALRIFGLTLAAAEAGVFTLQEFQQALIVQIQSYETGGNRIDSDETYYTRWAEALTELLLRKSVLEPERLHAAEQAVRAALIALQHDHDDDTPPAPKPLYVESAQ